MSKFYNFPYNYRTGASAHEADASWNAGDAAIQVQDGRTDTYSTADRILIQFPSSLLVSQIFIVSSGVMHVQALTFDGSASLLVNSAVPTSEGSISLLRGGRHYNHFDATQQATNGVRLQLTGSRPRVYSVAFTHIFLDLDEESQWTDIRHRIVQEGSERRMNVNGNSVTIPGRSNRWKYQTDYRGFFASDASPSVDTVLRQLERNHNFFFYPNETNTPYLFYPATLDPASLQIEYVGQLLTQQELSFTVSEL